VGIDLGTSQLKALVASLDGQVLGRGRAAYQVAVPADGHAETDPEDWWRAATAAVREALAGAAGTVGAAGAAGASGAVRAAGAVDVTDGAGVDVVGVGLAGQMHGVVLADAAGAPCRPAILWLDRRAGAEAARYRELPGQLTAPLGNQPSPGMAGPILCWLRAREPASLDRARWALPPKDWLRMRLTGEPATDPTDASGTLLFDLENNVWADNLVEALGLPRDKLPEIREPAAVAGHLRPGPAGELGLPAGIPVATGAADTAASLYAIGLDNSKMEVEEGGKGGEGGEKGKGEEALLTLGTGGQWIVPESSFRPTETTNLFRAISKSGISYYRLAAAQNVGVTLDWVRTVLGVSWQDLYDTAARPWRPDTPVFLPYLTAERWDTAASAHGTWAGLTFVHGQADLSRSALEGVAFLLNDRLNDLRAAGHQPERVILGGGGTDHPGWRRLLADVLGLPLLPASTSWLSATGAGLIAAEAVAESEPTGASRGRSEYGKGEVVAPGERTAASASYDRFLFFRRSWPTS
jgi:xylulokinase